MKNINKILSLVLVSIFGLSVITEAVFPTTKTNNCTSECTANYHIHKTDDTSFWDSHLEFIQIEKEVRPEILSVNKMGNFKDTDFGLAYGKAIAVSADSDAIFDSDASITLRYNEIGLLNNEKIGVDVTYKNPYHIGYLRFGYNFWNGAYYQGPAYSSAGSIDLELRFFKTNNSKETIIMDENFSLMASSLDRNINDINHHEGISFKNAAEKIITIRANGNIRRSKDYPQHQFNTPDVFFGDRIDNYVDNKDHPNFAYNGLMFSLPNQPVWKMTFCSISNPGRPDAYWFYFGGYGLNLKTPASPNKTVDKSEASVDEEITYKINQTISNVPISGYGKYDKFEIIDNLPKEVDFISADLTSTNGAVPSNAGNVSYIPSTHQVKYTFNYDYLWNQMPYQGQTYTLNIHCKLNNKALNPFTNTATSFINKAELNTNEVKVTPKFKITTEVINGTITENQFNINAGQDRTISYAPNPGHMIQSITIDGTQVNWHNYKDSYLFSDIKANHHIKVVYTPIPDKEIEVTKIWKDRNNAYDTRPESLNINILQNGKAYKTENFSSNDNLSNSNNIWQKTIKVPQYDQYQQKLNYSIQEEVTPFMELNYEDPVYNQDTLTVQNKTFFSSVKDEMPEYKITVHKNIVDKNNQVADKKDFDKVNLNYNDTFEFPIILKAYKRNIVNDKQHPVHEQYGNLSGEIYKGIATNKGDLIFNNIPPGKYLIEEIPSHYFDFVNFEKAISSTNATIENTKYGYIITLPGLTSQNEEITVNVTNRINSERPYDKTSIKNNIFKN